MLAVLGWMSEGITPTYFAAADTCEELNVGPQTYPYGYWVVRCALTLAKLRGERDPTKCIVEAREAYRTQGDIIPEEVAGRLFARRETGRSDSP